MTQTRRLILNLLATFSRTLYVTVCGLLTGRWALQVLGDENYGLLILVGGLIAFIEIFSSVFSASVSRYYAYAIGEAEKDLSKGIQECRAWFNVALLVHTLAPFLILIIGYPIGSFFIQNYLNIPPERLTDCIWIFRFTCISCFAGLLTAPFRAMFIAKQLIAELTIYTFVNTTLYLLVLLYMLVHPGDWLLAISGWMMIQVLFPALVITVRAFCIFPECRIRFREMIDFTRMKKLFSFAGWQFIGNLGAMLQTQLNAIFVNLFLGPAFNATNGIATSLAGRAQNFSNELNNVFAPAITSHYGADHKTAAHKLAYRCSKYSVIILLFFIIPLSLEIHTVITLWLGNPPRDVYWLCVLICVAYLLLKLTCGQLQVLNASGRIAQAKLYSFFAYLSAPLIAAGCFYYSRNIIWLGWAMVFSMMALSIIHLWCVRQEGCKFKDWTVLVFKPVFIVTLISSVCGYSITLLFTPSIVRCLFVGLTTTVSWGLSSWFFAMSTDEKEWVYKKIRSKLEKPS